VTPCSLVVGYQRFRGPCSLHLQVLLPQHYTVLHLRRTRPEYSSPWKPQMSHTYRGP